MQYTKHITFWVAVGAAATLAACGNPLQLTPRDANGSIAALNTDGSQSAAAGNANGNGTSGNANASTDGNALNGNVDNGPSIYQGVYFANGGAQGPSLYISKQLLSCDANALAAGQAVYRIDLSVAAPQNYSVAANFQGTAPTATVKGARLDPNCQASAPQDIITAATAISIAGSNVTGAATPTDGNGVTDANNTAPANSNGVTDPNTFSGYSGTLMQGSAVNAAFMAIACPGSDPYYQPDAQCTTPESCAPIGVTCMP